MTQVLSRINKPILALIVGNIILGLSVPIVKYALPEIPIFSFLFVRFLISGLILLPFIKLKKPTLSQAALLIAVALLDFTLHIGLLFIGLGLTESINIPLIFSAAPVALYFLSIKYLKERGNARMVTGMFVALLGVLVVILSPLILGGQALSLAKFEGNLLIVGALLANAVAILFRKKLLQEMPPLTVMSFTYLLGGIGFLPLVGYDGAQAFVFTPLVWMMLAFMVVIVTLIAHGLITYGLSKIGAHEIGVFTYIDPIATVLVAVPLLGEIPGPDFYIGALLVFGGIFIAEKRLHWHPFHKLRVKG